jgi:hypothetical protein
MGYYEEIRKENAKVRSGYIEILQIKKPLTFAKDFSTLNSNSIQ